MRLINDEITEKYHRKEEQKVSAILDCLNKKYGRTELEKMEKSWNDLSNFKVSTGDDGEELVSKLKRIVDDVIEKIDIENKHQ